MAAKQRQHKRPSDLPRTIYLNKKRYWWKVQLPGETKTKAVPLKPVGARYAAVTKVRKEMGYETAGAALGHTNMSATAIYAERNQGLADEAAKRFG